MTAILYFSVNIVVGLSLGILGWKGARRIERKQFERMNKK